MFTVESEISGAQTLCARIDLGFSASKIEQSPCQIQTAKRGETTAYQHVFGDGEADFEILPERHRCQSRIPGTAISFETRSGGFRLLPANAGFRIGVQGKINQRRQVVG